ncbi:hypothetical protein GCM10010304_80560 [Streptomyces roseoviolaceus]
MQSAAVVGLGGPRWFPDWEPAGGEGPSRAPAKTVPSTTRRPYSDDMDAAVAGLIGALGGGAIGALGAWGAAAIAFRGARYQADQQRESPHNQWLRETRRDGYAAFIAAASTLFDHLLGVRSATTAEERVKEVHNVQLATEKLGAVVWVVWLEAPDDISVAAQQLSQDAIETCESVLDAAARNGRRPGSLTEIEDAVFTALSDKIKQFTLLCKDSLGRRVQER